MSPIIRDCNCAILKGAHLKKSVIFYLTLEGSMGMCRPLDPLFRPFFHSGDPPFQALFQLQSLHLNFWRKKRSIFKLNFLRFWLNFSSWDTYFSINPFRRSTLLSSKKKNPFRRPYFWKSGWHIPTKILFTGYHLLCVPERSRQNFGGRLP